MVIRDRPSSITVDEFEAFITRPENRDRLFELIEGEIVEKMPTQLHGYVALQFGIEVGLYLREHPIGNAFVEARYRPVDDTKNDRLPDISICLTSEIVSQDATPGMPDIAIEIQSPDDNPRDMIQKAYFYLDNGAKMVILVMTATRQVMRITASEMLTFNETDTFDCGDLLPGFRLLIRKIFPPRQSQ